ncbi:hypothetical protein AKJ09_01269 [Labilithrix luteola]|uniref:4Fe-4S ferredoxin-type domain-containing protein n=1 Tax=Labilithrix luteola TaxID=1391654 RepID=A0A0K1PM55_9BACT|nr:hypothetical protein [Labilithrix luteola]AKU94605.1 hypothetical protein AKJ09_01269 [Labilithrix luteola]
MRRVSRITALLAIAAAAGCTLDNALVGGRCADGFVQSNQECVPESSAPAPSGSTTPTAVTDATPPLDAGSDAPDTTPLPDASTPDTSVPDSSAPDAEEPDSSTPDTGAPDAPLVCEAPLVACRGQCLSVESDGQNCGACGKICPSNICVAGVCQGATPGDVVVIGHDFAQAWLGSAQAKVLLNAMTIPTTDPIRVLSYEDGASPLAVAQVRALVTYGIHGRGVQIVRAPDASALTSPTLSTYYDVVLVHDGAGLTPAALGASWATSLGTFTQKGGVVVALDGASSDMPSLLTASGLVSVASHAPLAEGTHLEVSAPADVVGAQVLSPYAAIGVTVGFGGVSAPDLTVVVREKTDAGDGTPVVVHRTVR